MSARVPSNDPSGPPWVGVAFALSAFLIWGLAPMFYKALSHVPPLEVLSHRTLWSFAFIGGYALLTGRAARIREALGDRRSFAVLAAAAVLIGVNWFFYIFAIQIGRTTEASLGYYILPLMSVALGVLVLKEPLSKVQLGAVALAAAAVLLLTLGLGAAPWIALLLSTTFATYGLLKKTIAVGPVTSVTIEAMLLSPLALLWLYGAHVEGWRAFVDRPGGWFGANWADTALLIASGPLTGGPLLLFAAAAQRMRYATLGLLQYLNPTLQLICATAVFGEPFTLWHGIAFALIWTAIAIYTAGGRSTRRVLKGPVSPPVER